MKKLVFPILLSLLVATVCPIPARAVVCPSATAPTESMTRSAAHKVTVKEKLAVRLAKKKAADIVQGNSGKDQIVAFLLCFFLGFLGIHRFYLGYNGLGVLYLLTLGLFGIGWLVDTILLIIPGGLTPKGEKEY